MRAGTAIPTGSAERTLASLYQQRVEAWPFLAERLPASEVGCEAEAGRLEEAEQERSATIKPEDSTNEGGRGEKTDDQQEQQPAQSREGHGTDAKKKGSVSTSDKTACKSFSLTRLSAALEAFTRTRADRGCQLDDFRAQDLADFLYLGGQAKARYGDPIAFTSEALEPVITVGKFWTHAVIACLMAVASLSDCML